MVLGTELDCHFFFRGIERGNLRLLELFKFEKNATAIALENFSIELELIGRSMDEGLAVTGIVEIECVDMKAAKRADFRIITDADVHFEDVKGKVLRQAADAIKALAQGDKNVVADLLAGHFGKNRWSGCGFGGWDFFLSFALMLCLIIWGRCPHAPARWEPHLNRRIFCGWLRWRLLVFFFDVHEGGGIEQLRKSALAIFRRQAAHVGIGIEFIREVDPKAANAFGAQLFRQFFRSPLTGFVAVVSNVNPSDSVLKKGG